MNADLATAAPSVLRDPTPPAREHVLGRTPAARIDGGSLTFWQALVGIASFAIFLGVWAWALARFGILLGGLVGWLPAAMLAAASFMVLGLAYAVVAQGAEMLLHSKRREQEYFAPSWLQQP